jgi:GTP-binding protein
MEWTVTSRGLIGYRSEFLTDTRGTGTLYHVFSHYDRAQDKRRKRLNGVMVSMEQGQTVAFALFNLQERAQMFLGPGHEVYSGQIVALNSRDNDLTVNPCKGKKLTNIRAAGSDETIILTPPREFSLEEALEFIEGDELVEVTPKSIRLRKRQLDHNQRKRDDRASD